MEEKNPTDRRYGGTFNLDSCIALFCYTPDTHQAAVFHIPASTTDWENLTQQLRHLTAETKKKKIHITIAPGANPFHIPDIERAIARINLPQMVRLRRLPAPVEHKNASYIASLAAYVMDSTTGYIFPLDNASTDHMAMHNHIPDVTGPSPSLRMSFASGCRFLNLPQTTGMAKIFSSGKFHPSTMDAHLQTLTYAARQTYRKLQMIADTPDKDAISSLWRQRASALLHRHIPAFADLDDQTRAMAMNQLEWHFQESLRLHQHKNR